MQFHRRALLRALVEPFTLPWRHSSLLIQLSKRDIMGRYRGSMFGLLWSILTPLIMLLIYSFVFGVIFKARWGNTTPADSHTFILLMFSGLIVHGLLAECLNKAPGLIVSQPNYVKKIVFPIEILPWATLYATLFHSGINLLILISALLFTGQGLPLTALWLPVVILPLLLLVLGLSWFLSALGVYLRDIGQVIGFVTAALLFLSPIFYPLSAIPEDFQPLLHLSPITLIVEQLRNCLIWGNRPDLPALAIYFGISLAVAVLGHAWFQKTRRGFADVL